MPQPRVLDTSTSYLPEQTSTQKLFDTIGSVYKEGKDKEEFNQIIDSYKKNREQENAWEDLNLAVQKSNISPSRRVEALKDLDTMKKTIIEEKKAAKLDAATIKKLEARGVAKRTLERQKEILKTGHLGPAVSFMPGKTGRKAGSTVSSEGSKLRAEYMQNGKALIQAASPLVIRNKPEFEVLAEKLYDPTLPQEEIEGILTSLERIISDELGDQPQGTTQPSPSSNPTRPPLTSFDRK